MNHLGGRIAKILQEASTHEQYERMSRVLGGMTPERVTNLFRSVQSEEPIAHLLAMMSKKASKDTQLKEHLQGVINSLQEAKQPIDRLVTEMPTVADSASFLEYLQPKAAAEILKIIEVKQALPILTKMAKSTDYKQHYLQVMGILQESGSDELKGYIEAVKGPDRRQPIKKNAS